MKKRKTNICTFKKELLGEAIRPNFYLSMGNHIRAASPPQDIQYNTPDKKNTNLCINRIYILNLCIMF